MLRWSMGSGKSLLIAGYLAWGLAAPISARGIAFAHHKPSGQQSQQLAQQQSQPQPSTPGQNGQRQQGTQSQAQPGDQNSSQTNQNNSSANQSTSSQANSGQAANPVTPMVAATTGVVRTEENVTVPGASVRLTNLDTNKAWVTWTDANGKFEFPELPAGRYRVEASELGFQASSSEIVLPLVPAGPIPVVLHVATLADLEGNKPARTQAGPNGPGHNRQGQGAGGQGSGNNSANAGNPASGGANGTGRRGAYGGQRQMSGAAQQYNQEIVAGGFQETGLTGDSGTGEQTTENGSPQTNTTQAPPPPSVGGANGSSASSDSFLLQGTVGQGFSGGGPGGFPGGGFGSIQVGDQRGPGGFGGGPGGPGGPGGGAGFAGPGGFAGGFGRGGGGSPGGAGGRGRLGRQTVNRVRFGLTDKYENSAFDARPYAIRGTETPKTPHFNEMFGANIGGPMKIPHVIKGDKTFFFVNYAHTIQRTAVDSFSTVPTMDERNGNFCLANAGTPTLFNPFNSGAPFPTVADTNCASGSAQQVQPSLFPDANAVQGILGYIPLPNVPGVTQNYQLLGANPSSNDTLNAHVFQTINSKFNVNGGYNFNSTRSTSLGMFPGLGGNTTSLSQAVTLGLSHNWSPRIVENMQLNWSRSATHTLAQTSYGTDIESELGIAGVSPAPINYGVPTISMTSFSGIQDTLPSIAKNETTRFSDSVSWTKGTHTMRFGGEIRRIQLNSLSDPDPRGQFTFTGLETSELDATGQPIAGTGSDFADFLIGLPEATAVQFGIDPDLYLRSWGFVAYGQDDWRVNKKFTLEYGLRYEDATPAVELFNHLADLEFNPTITQAAVVLPGQVGPYSGFAYPQSLVQRNHGNLEPRFGFAWQPPVKPKTIVRAGYSIFYNEAIFNTLARELAYQPPFETTQSLLTSGTQQLTLENGFPSQPGFIANTEGVDPNYKTGYAQLWMLSTETDLAKNWVLNLTYTGTKGTNLDLLRIPNRAPLGTAAADTQEDRSDPDATGFLYDQSGANSIYNALQVRVVHRFTSGLSLQAFYTWSKSMDNASSIGGSAVAIVQQDGNYAAERGLSSFDMRHQVRLNSVYELPFGDRKRWANHGWSDRIFGNWRLLNTVTWHTGTPLTAILGGSESDNGTGTNFSLRAQQIGNPNISLCGGSVGSYFSTGAFAVPAVGTYGDEHRGAIEGPCSFVWNFSVNRSFRFGSSDRRKALDVRWEIQNLTNTPTFSGVSALYGSALFGQITSAGAMRSMDITGRVNF